MKNTGNKPESVFNNRSRSSQTIRSPSSSQESSGNAKKSVPVNKPSDSAVSKKPCESLASKPSENSECSTPTSRGVSQSSDSIGSVHSTSAPNISTESADFDILEVSRYPISNIQNVTIGKMQEIKLQQKIIKEIKYVQSIEENILREQKLYWLFTHNITNEDAKTRIKSAVEMYCMLHATWISGSELEININPDQKIEKIPGFKKKV